MTFRYYVAIEEDEPERPRGLFAVNRDVDAGRLDTMLYSHLRKRWVSDPDVVSQALFGLDNLDRRREVDRSQAEEAASIIGTDLPSEEELMRISDEAERRRAVRWRRRWYPTWR